MAWKPTRAASRVSATFPSRQRARTPWRSLSGARARRPISSGANAFTTQGAGAIGLVATQGGVITATGPISITTSGGASPATGFPSGSASTRTGQARRSTSRPRRSRPPDAGAIGLAASDADASGAGGRDHGVRDAHHQDDQRVRRRRPAAGKRRFGRRRPAAARFPRPETRSHSPAESTRPPPSTISPSPISPAISSSPTRRSRPSISTPRPPMREPTTCSTRPRAAP